MSKRILSMLLALVMVLSMVPVQALAEEVPELEATPVNETVTEEPVVEEPVVEEPVVEEPVVEEPVVEEPVVEEPVVEEPVVEEPVVEEPVVEEPVVEEPVVEVTVAAESVTISQADELTELAVGAELPLTAAVLPEETTDKTVVWTSSDETIATVDENGVVTGVALGEVTITAACGEVSGTYELTVVEAVVTTELVEVDTVLDVPEEELPEIRYTIKLDEQTPTELQSGKTMTLKAVVEPCDELKDKPLPIIAWNLVNPNDAEYVTLTAGGVLKAKADIYNRHDGISLQAKLKDAEGYYLSEDTYEGVTWTIDIVPRIREIVLTVDDAAIKNNEYAYNLLDGSLTAGVTLKAVTLPEGTGNDVTWKVNDAWGVCEYENMGSEVDGSALQITATGKTGTATVTATAKDGSGVYAKITIRFVKTVLADGLEILNLSDGDEIRGGSTVNLTTNIQDSKLTPFLTDRGVLWSIEKGKEYASISSSGKLTTKLVKSQQEVTIRATAKANADAYADVTIQVNPSVTSVKINKSAIGATAIRFGSEPIQLDWTVEPYTACQGVTWETSNKKIATVDENGLVTPVGAGKVRITCMAADGSRKSDYVTLEIVKPVDRVELDWDNPTELRSGSSVRLTGHTYTEYTDKDGEQLTLATNQKLTWKVGEWVEGELVKTDAAVITSDGRLTAKAVNVDTEVAVIAVSPETLEEDSYTVTIKPKNVLNLVPYVDGVQVNGTVSVNADSEPMVSAVWYSSPNGEAAGEYTAYDCLFSSSKKDVATIDEDGNVTPNKTGTTVITVQCTDEATGVLYTVKFNLKVTNLVSDITIAEPKYDYLRSGSSVTLKATTWTRLDDLKASNQKVYWSVTDAKGDATDAATVSSSGKVTAKTVTENTDIIVWAEAAENGAVTSIDLTIRPKQSFNLSVTYGTEDKSGTVYAALNKGASADDLKVQAYISAPGVMGDGTLINISPDEITWTSSDKKVVNIVDGKPVFVGTGKAKLTAKVTATISGKKTTYSATITMQLINAVTEIEVIQQVKNQHLYAGKSIGMRAIVKALDAGNTVSATNKRVKWSLAPEDAEYATINPSTGVVTAKKTVTESVDITVIAEATDVAYYGGSETPVTGEYKLTVYPRATELTLEVDGSKVENKGTFTGDVGLEYTVAVTPEYTDVKWTSSSPSVAYVTWDSDAEEYQLIVRRRGTATIKATAQDGSAKTASFTVKAEN